MSTARRVHESDCTSSDLTETAKDVIELDLQVLGFFEDGMWCALALELDLCGMGQSFDEAMIDLTNAIEAQVSFAIQQDNLDGIFAPAPDRYFQVYKNPEEIKSVESFDSKQIKIKMVRKVVPLSSEIRDWLIDENSTYGYRNCSEDQ